MAFITSAKILAATVIDLMADEAKEARAIVDDFQPELTKEEYLNLLDSLSYRKMYEMD